MEDDGVGVRIESDVATLKEAVIRIDKRLDEGFGAVDRRFGEVDRRFDKVEQRLASLDGKLNELDKRMTGVETGLGLMGQRQAELHIDMRELRNSLDAKFVWMVTTMIAFGSAVLLVLARGFHWLG